MVLLDERELAEQAAYIDSLLAEIESIPDPAMRESLSEIIQGLLGLYGAGLARMLELVEAQGEQPANPSVLQAFMADDLINHLLLLHDLHPLDVEVRVAQALEEVRPYLKSHGGNVELLGVRDGVALVRLQGSCNGCPSSTMTLKLAIEEAVRKAAPELEGVEAEGVGQPPSQPVAFLPISELRKKPAEVEQSWTDVADLPPLSLGRMHTSTIAGSRVLFIRLEETLVAYRDLCADCGASLAESTLRATQLCCAACGHRYDVQRAGRSLDAPQLYLQPVPLLVRDGAVQVAAGGV